MRVLLFTLEYPPFKGGVANVYGNLVKHWPGKNKIIVLNNNENQLLNKKFFIPWLPSFWTLWQGIKKHKIDHVLVGHLLPLGTVTFVLSKILKFEYSVIIHGMDFDYALRSGRKKFLTDKILSGSKNIICMNSYVAKKVEDFTKDAKKIQIVNPGINVEYRAEEIKSVTDKIIPMHDLDKKFVIFSICRLVERKGIDTVIKATKLLVEKYPNLYYYIAGVGPEEKELKKLAENQKNIVFLGKISDKEKWGWLSSCDLFAMPTKEIEGDYEGFGIVYLEANLLGKAVIASKNGGVEDAVIDYETGIMCDSESVEDVAGAIDELYSSYVLREELGQNGMRRVAENFAWDKQIGKLFHIISQ